MSDSESQAREFVQGRYVNWQGVAGRLLSSLILVVGGGVIYFWEAVALQVGRWIDGVFRLISLSLSFVWVQGAVMFEAAWMAAGLEFPMAGPFDFAIAVAVIAVTFWVAITGVQLIIRVIE